MEDSRSSHSVALNYHALSPALAFAIDGSEFGSQWKAFGSTQPGIFLNLFRSSELNSRGLCVLITNEREPYLNGNDFIVITDYNHC